MSLFHGNFEFNGNHLTNIICLPIDKALEILTWRNHPEVRRWMYTDTVISESDHLKFIEGLRVDNANYYWRLDGKTGIGIGVLYFNKVDFSAGTCEFGMYTNPFSSLKGGGLYIGKIAKILAFDIGKLVKIRLQVFADNSRAVGIDRLLGFEEECREKALVFKSGSLKDILVMGITRPET